MSNEIVVNSDSVDKVTGLLEKLAEQLGVAADHFYPIFVQQQIIDGWYSVAWTAALAAVGALFSFFLVKEMRKGLDGDVVGWCAMFAIISFGFAFFIGASSLTHIINPEYHALMAISNFAGNIK